MDNQWIENRARAETTVSGLVVSLARFQKPLPPPVTVLVQLWIGIGSFLVPVYASNHKSNQLTTTDSNGQADERRSF
jgi:hypothetical protein